MNKAFKNGKSSGAPCMVSKYSCVPECGRAYSKKSITAYIEVIKSFSEQCRLAALAINKLSVAVSK